MSDSSVNGGNKDVFIVILVLSILHALEYDASTWNAVKRLANQNRVNCLFKYDRPIRYVELSRDHQIFRTQRTVNEEEKLSG